MEGSLFRVVWAMLALFPGLCRADSLNNEWISSTRALSMGNTGIASAEDPTTATFYNPAALAKLRKPSFEFLSPQFELGTGLMSTSSSLVDWGKHASFGASQDLVKAKPGKISSGGVSFFPNFSSQNFSFGVAGRMQRWSYYSAGEKSWRFYSRYLVMPTMGLSIAAWGGRLRLGLAVRGVQVTETYGLQPDVGSSLPLLITTGEGLGIGLDGGVLLTMPWAALPTIGLVARNVGDTAFPTAGIVKWGGAGKERHSQIKMTYDAAFSLSSKGGKGSGGLNFAVDYRDIYNRTGAPTLRHLNVGFEMIAGKNYFFRLGVTQAYWTAGAGIATKEGSFDIGTHAEELDGNKLRSVEDRHISIRYTRRF